jgi:hypothetical protein
MSEEYEDDEDNENSQQPKRISASLQAIKTLMVTEGLDYSQAYDRIINGKKPEPTPVSTPIPEPKKQQLSLENLNELVNSLNFDAEKIEMAKEEIARLEEDVGKRNVRNIELNAKLKQKLGQLNEARKMLAEGFRLLIEKDKELKQKIEAFNAQVTEFNKNVESESQKRKGYTKKISKSAEKEFEEE